MKLYPLEVKGHDKSSPGVSVRARRAWLTHAGPQHSCKHSGALQTPAEPAQITPSLNLIAACELAKDGYSLTADFTAECGHANTFRARTNAFLTFNVTATSFFLQQKIKNHPPHTEPILYCS